MSNPVGNPNIEEAYNKSTGPKTDIGKLKCSAGRIKKFTMNTHLTKGSQLWELMEKVKLKYAVMSDALDAMDLFISWLNSRSTKEVTEIHKLEKIIQILNGEMAKRVMWKLEGEQPLGDDDLKVIKLLKECITDVHQLKFGTKSLHVTASYDDIRQMMFNEDTGNK